MQNGPAKPRGKLEDGGHHSFKRPRHFPPSPRSASAQRGLDQHGIGAKTFDVHLVRNKASITDELCGDLLAGDLFTVYVRHSWRLLKGLQRKCGSDHLPSFVWALLANFLVALKDLHHIAEMAECYAVNAITAK